MNKTILVQRIRTVWTKNSRGGEGAVHRNAVPNAAKVPLPRQDAELALLHYDLAFDERQSFSPSGDKVSVNPESKPLVLGCVSIDWAEEHVKATFAWERSCGAPDRGWARNTLTVGVNEWAQIVYNGRFTDEGYWWYERSVVNVGVFEPPSSGVFTRSQPSCRFESLARLL